jgi:hypothetical protein
MAKAVMKEAKVETVMLPLLEVFEFPSNPNEEDSLVFNNLLLEIQEDGFDQPLIVVDRLHIENAPGWTVVSGNHRYRALRLHGYTHAACVVKDWDAEKARVKVIRRNLITGKLNDERFTRIVDELRTPYTPDQLADMLGFAHVDEFAKHYKKQHENQPRAEEDDGYGDPTRLVEGMTVILNKLFSEYGDTVPNSFVYFLAGTKIHLAIQANTQLRRALSKVAKRCVKEHKDINLVLAGVIAAGLAAVSTVEAEDLGRVDQDVDEEWQPVVGKSASEANQS